MKKKNMEANVTRLGLRKKLIFIDRCMLAEYVLRIKKVAKKTQWRQARIKGMIHMSMSETTIKLKKMDTKQVDMNGRLQGTH